jgi:hypothetical protein
MAFGGCGNNRHAYVRAMLDSILIAEHIDFDCRTSSIVISVMGSEGGTFQTRRHTLHRLHGTAALLCALSAGQCRICPSLGVQLRHEVLSVLDAQEITLYSVISSVYKHVSCAGCPLVPAMATQASQATPVPITLAAHIPAEGKAGSRYIQGLSILTPSLFQAVGYAERAVTENQLDRHESLESYICNNTQFNDSRTPTGDNMCLGSSRFVQGAAGKKRARITGIGNPPSVAPRSCGTVCTRAASNSRLYRCWITHSALTKP